MEQNVPTRRVAEAPKSIRRSMALLEALWPRAATAMAMRFFFKPMHFKVPEKEKPLRKSASKFKFNWKSQQLKAYQWGNEGPLVLLTHGWSGRGTQMGTIGTFLANQGFRCIAFDAPGHGVAKSKSTNLLEFKEGIDALIAHIGIPDFLVGHSLGGVASILAAEKLLTLKGLVVIGSPATTEMVLTDFTNRLGMSNRMTPLLMQAIEKKYRINLEQVSAMHVGPKLAVTTLLIYDKDDLEVSFKNGELLHKAWPNAEFMVTEKLGHRKLLFEKNILIKVADFLNRRISNN